MADIVQRMRDIHLPEPGFWWPPAPGWWLLALLLAALVLGAGWLFHRRGRLRRQALAELEQLRGRFRREGDRRALAMALNVLLRRVALAEHARDEVAPLRGEAWLAFLDRAGGPRRFSRGEGRVLLQAPYAPATPFDAEELLALAETWIRAVT